MALNIAAMQVAANPVSEFIEGRALRRAEEEGAMRMTALQNAEGRAAAEEQRQQSRFNWEEAATKVQFDQETAKRTLAGVNQVLAIPKGERKAFVEKNFPDFVQKLSEQEYGWDEVDEDEIEEMAQGLGAQSSAALGQSPTKASPLSEQGKVTADVRSGLLTPEQGDAILNASEYTAPEAGIIGGTEAVYQVNKKTGEPRVVPGVAPRAQKPLVTIDQSAERSSERKLAELDAEDFRAVKKRGFDAADKAQSIRALLQSPAVTGPTQDLRASANAFFKDLGVPIAQSKIDQIANLEQYKGVLSQSVLSEQLKQSGPQTESDAKRIEATFGNTSNIKEANELILKYQLALAERESLMADLVQDYREKNGKIEGWDKEARKYVRETPLALNNPKSGRLVFWNEFREQVKSQKPDATDEDIMNRWRRYGEN